MPDDWIGLIMSVAGLALGYSIGLYIGLVAAVWKRLHGVNPAQE